MHNFETQHFFKIEKEKNGIIFAVCIRHSNSEFGVGIRRGNRVEMIYIGTDEYYAKKLYSDLIFWKKMNNLRTI